MSKQIISMTVFVISIVGTTSAWGQMSTSTDVSSTTSGSVKRLFVENESERLMLFVDNNFERLQESAAKGSGTILSDYVHLMGCQDTGGVITRAIQKNYSQLFVEGKAGLVRKTEQLIEQDAELTLSCGTHT